MWWKMSLAVVLGVVLGFGLNYAVVHNEAAVFARKCRIAARPNIIPRYVIEVPEGCTKVSYPVDDRQVQFVCENLREKPDASICATQLYEQGKHPVIIGEEPEPKH